MNHDFENSKPPNNPPKLADETVLALSSLLEGKDVSPVVLEEGVGLCKYLIKLLEGKDVPSPQWERWESYSTAVKKAFLESNIDQITMLKDLRSAMEGIKEILLNPSQKKPNQIKEIQMALINVTMPLWRIRTSDFRERKFKRGLIIRG